MKKLTILLIVLAAFLTISFTIIGGTRHSRLERDIEIEEWMTMPFDSTLEAPLVVEDWMTRPFITLNS